MIVERNTNHGGGNMEKLLKVLVQAGILLAAYSFIGRFLGDGQQIGFGMVTIMARSGLIMANAMMLIAVSIKLFFLSE